jgi:Spy/CpxP family protein refolding chaperone
MQCSSRVLLLFCEFMLAVGLTGVAWGQDKASKGNRVKDPGERHFLLRNKSVWQELKLTEAQTEKIDAVLREIWDKYEAIRSGDLEADLKDPSLPKLMKEKMEVIRKGLGDVLTADQEKRLWQIHLQRHEYLAFLEPEVQQALNVTVEQKKKMAAIAEEAAKQTAQVLKLYGTNFEEAAKRSKESRNRSLNDMLAVLTGVQKKIWNDIIGPPIHLDPLIHPPRN